MFYVVPKWIKDKNNEDLIHEILNKYIGSDVNPNNESAIKELEAIGETEIIDKLKNGYFTH